MDPAISFGLVSALAYGAADYLSQIAGKAVGAWRASFYYYALGVAALSTWIALQPFGLQHASSVPLSGWLISIGSGLSLLAAVVFFTHGLIKGSIAVVAPITASYGAVSTGLSFIVGERFTHWAAIGIALTVAGACGAAVRPSGTRLSTQSSGIGWASAAAFAYGFGFWLQGFAVPVMGPLLPAWTVYATGVVVMGGLQIGRLIDLAPPRSLSLMVPGAASAILSIFAFLALTLGLSTGRPAVVIVLSSLTSAVTVILSRLINHARMAWYQWIAVASVIIGLCFMKK